MYGWQESAKTVSKHVWVTRMSRLHIFFTSKTIAKIKDVFNYLILNIHHNMFHRTKQKKKEKDKENLSPTNSHLSLPACLSTKNTREKNPVPVFWQNLTGLNSGKTSSLNESVKKREKRTRKRDPSTTNLIERGERRLSNEEVQHFPVSVGSVVISDRAFQARRRRGPGLLRVYRRRSRPSNFLPATEVRLQETRCQPEIEISGGRLQLSKLFQSLALTARSSLIGHRTRQPENRVRISDPPFVVTGNFAFGSVVGSGSAVAKKLRHRPDGTATEDRFNRRLAHVPVSSP